MTINLPLPTRLRYFLIKSRYKKWIFPFLCTIPYVSSLIWLSAREQFWIVQIMLAPILMILMILFLSYFLAKIEFRR